jgi:hypothetical protein
MGISALIAIVNYQLMRWFQEEFIIRWLEQRVTVDSYVKDVMSMIEIISIRTRENIYLL